MAYKFKRMFVAGVAHEVHRAYCESLGDFSHPVWKDAPDWQIQTLVNGVAFHRGNKDATPEMSHENWVKEKLADGWVYGPVKDAEKKEHPALVPYEQLSQEQRTKDFLFRAVVHALGEELPE